ncbi:endonuclease/exonuclease/phosphatase family protein [Vibrio anguillarum]|uniref:endonuclease/exonuclease/phosphatase family protein n=1 Tax=Vibrio anguillarum TaxID=55601 RepID=UPI003593E67E
MRDPYLCFSASYTQVALKGESSSQQETRLGISTAKLHRSGIRSTETQILGFNMTITFATINLFNYLAPPNAYYQFDNIYTQAEWQQKKQWFGQKIQQLDADIIGFQEVFSFDELRNQMMDLGYPYVACVDEPIVKDGYIYSHPIVVIASRYPLRQVSAVHGTLPNPAAPFAFNRTPLHATVCLPMLGDIDVYIVHFKSQRPAESPAAPHHLIDEWQQETLGRWLSTVQRGFEANLTHQYIVNTQKQTGRPCVLMGDFNKPLHHEEFQGLLSQALYRRPETQQPLAGYALYDAWDLHTESVEQPRKATHYAGATGSVLDYILLSADFAPFIQPMKSYISHYTVLDQHLVNPSYELDNFSTDHALVAVTLKVNTVPS